MEKFAAFCNREGALWLVLSLGLLLSFLARNT